MDEYICNDRQDALKVAEEINRMTDEEFEAYCENLKSEENNITIISIKSSVNSGGCFCIKKIMR